MNLGRILGELREKILSIKDFFEKVHPIVFTLFLMLMVSVPITLVSSALNTGVNAENLADIRNFFKTNKPAAVAYDVILKIPLKEEAKYRLPIMFLSYLKFFLTLENPLVWFVIILPGIPWAQGHAVPLAALVDSLILGWLVFKIGGIRGWLAALLVHVLINFSIFLGYAVNLMLQYP
jgi:hypothetical protein